MTAGPSCRSTFWVKYRFRLMPTFGAFVVNVRFEPQLAALSVFGEHDGNGIFAYTKGHYA